MNSDERAKLLRERLKVVNPLSGKNAPLSNPTKGDAPPSRRPYFRYLLPRQNGPKGLVQWVQIPDPPPPLLEVDLPQSPLVPLAQRWFEEWQAKMRRSRRLGV